MYTSTYFSLLMKQCNDEPNYQVYPLTVHQPLFFSHRDGVPLYRGRPSVSLHAHRGPVKFLLPLMYATNTLEMNRSSSLRSTLRSRPSKRNMERLELMESSKKQATFQSYLLDASSLIADDSMNSRRKSSTLPTQFSRDTPGVYSLGNSDLSSSGAIYSRSIIEEENGGEDKKEKEKSKSKKWGMGKKKGVEKKKSLDDTDIVIRRSKDNIDGSSSKSSSLMKRKSQTLSFRSELANRIVIQSKNLSQSNLELSMEQPHEVEMLYENLLEDNVSAMFDRSSKKSKSARSKTNFEQTYPPLKSISLSNPQSKEMQHSTNSFLSPSFIPADEYSNDREILSGKQISPSPSSVSHSSGDSGSTAAKNSVPLSDRPVASGISRDNWVRSGTMRKGNGCNAVIVLSGGDGYQDLDRSRAQPSTGDDACVLVWLYKF